MSQTFDITARTALETPTSRLEEMLRKYKQAKREEKPLLRRDFPLKHRHRFSCAYADLGDERFCLLLENVINAGNVSVEDARAALGDQELDAES